MMACRIPLKICSFVFALFMIYYISWIYNIEIKKYRMNIFTRDLIDNEKRLLILTTSWKSSMEKQNVHKNTGQLWSLWPGLVQPVAYMEDSEVFRINENYRENMEMLIQHGWFIKPIPKVACGKVPVLKSMILDAIRIFKNSDFYGFANSDIIFNEGLTKTLESVNKTRIKNGPLLIIGRRTNVNFTDGRTIERLENVAEVAKSGSLMKGIALDYFLTNRHFPWHLLPDLVVGRIHYDNWLVYFAITLNITVIDATNTVIAVHQTTADGNEAGRKHNNAYCNQKVIAKIGKPFKTRWGYTTCVPFYTKWNSESNQVEIAKRNIWKHCNPYV